MIGLHTGHSNFEARPQARIRPKQREMELELDIDWSTCGCHLVVDSLVLVGDKQWNMKLTAVEIALRGRLRFVLKLSKTCMPGIEGAGHAVQSPPPCKPPSQCALAQRDPSVQQS